MTVIKDGSGTGFLAEVGSSNDLHVRAITISELSEASEVGVAFEAEGETTITALTEKTVLILINNGDISLEIGNIFISSQNETGKITKVKIYLGNKTYTSGGTPKSARNLNTGSGNVSDVTIVEDNPTLGGTDTKIIELYFQSGDGNNIVIPFDGGIFLERTGSLRVTVTGDTLAAGTFECDASCQFWEERIL